VGAAGGAVINMRTYTPDDIVQGVKTRRWWVLIPFAIGLALAPLLAQLAPEKYRSETLILVVPQRVPDSYVKATVTEKIEDRLPSISEQILSRSRLERIITDMSLYSELRRNRVMEDVVEAMRKDVTVTLAGAKDNADSFRVSYVNDTPDVARKVTERLASLYIEQNLKDRENQASSTSQFLETQLQDAKQRLVDQEKKLEAYRNQHSGELPTQLQGNLQSIQNASLQLQALNESKNRAVERRLLIERQIADTEATPVSEPAAAPAQVVPTNTRQALDFARARLTALRERFTDEHPEVVAAQRAVTEQQARLEGEGPLGDVEGGSTPKALTPAEAAQRKRILDLKAELLVVDKQLESTRTEETQLKSAIANLQGKVDVLPSRESELVELTRDYTTLQASYSSLLLKREDSMMAANLERRQIGEQFRILDPASMPERPFNLVQRLGVTFAGAGVGLLLGLVFVVVLELRDSSFRSEDEVMAALSLPVLALIPTMSSPREQRERLWRRRWTDLAGTTLLLLAVVVVVIWRLRA
jgi:polysaccharide chain length determinant protein (PEP-CTERM system associated)